MSILNIRGDGRPSLFVGNAAPGLRPSMDHIFVNRGKRFVERRTAGLPSVQNTRCSSTGDFDRDGRQDFLSCSNSLPPLQEPHHPGPDRCPIARWRRTRAFLRGRWQDAELVHLNRDRWPDLVTVFTVALDVRLNKAGGAALPGG